MMRSLYSGVSGLKTHQTKMDVIGNNISNVNTTAYKSSSITFSELMSQTTQSASGPNATTGTGGTNAKQIGLGVKSGAINVNISTQGSAQSTGNPFDIMITGDNFFVVNDGLSNYFTRDGSFYVDGAGNLAMTSTGYNVMGWEFDETIGSIKKDSVTALRIMSAANMTYPPEATSKAYVSGILDKNDSDVTSANGKSINLNFYDQLGYSYTAKFVFKQSDDASEYSLELDSILDASGNEIDLSGVDDDTILFGTDKIQSQAGSINFDYTNYTWNGNQLLQAGTATVVADLSTLQVDVADIITKAPADATEQQIADIEASNKALAAVAAAYGYEGSVDEFLNLRLMENGVETTIEDLLISINSNASTTNSLNTMDGTNYSLETVGRNYEGVAIKFDPATGVFAGVNGVQTITTATIRLSSIPAATTANGLTSNFNDIEVDFSDISMFNNNGTSTVSATSGDSKGVGSGRTLGDMIGVSIQSNGEIYASYDNGMTKCLGQMATAYFSNAAGLQKEGDNLYSATLNSGEFDGIGVDVTANGGYMSTGQLEMSNVDLSSEFTEMIVTQRGFQANSRIITVSDTLLEELTNLKR
ncbi:MAG: flagellar hook-basal body complex protein [Lachnospiraceae bacterium]|nr:flagellar hook-basal body complex protein [Lachnospiraceae bacterium]